MSEEQLVSDSSSPTLSPVRLFISPQHVPAVPPSQSLSSSRIIHSDDLDVDLSCQETFLDDETVKRKFFEPVEDTFDRYVLSVKSGSQMISSLWDEIQLKQKRLQHEILSMKRTISYQEDENDQLKEDLKVLRAVNKMMSRTVHRLKKAFLEQEELDPLDECPICARTISDLLSLNLSTVRLGCCANEICLECIVNTTHAQSSNHPNCPFCRNPLC